MKIALRLLVLGLLLAVPGFCGESRIVSLAPEITEFLLELGGGSSIVGVSDSCSLPADASLIPRIGTVELNMERLVRLKPTAILDLNGAHRRYELLFRQLSLRYVNIGIDQLADIPSAAVRLSNELGTPDRGTAFTATWERQLSRLVSKHAHPKPRVYIETWDAPLQSATEKSFIGQLVQLAGGENVISDSSNRYPVVTDIQIITSNPEVIFIAYPIGDISRISSRPGWGDIDAVRKKRVYQLGDEQNRLGSAALKNLLALSNLLRTK
ncbi:MAG TPA: helical backbone metal receptor [Candidatus Ozemobacteraceae bacterium]|nr:helical backbone metal receptor [Candidatus Ozemobacteraceae bacterium]